MKSKFSFGRLITLLINMLAGVGCGMLSADIILFRLYDTTFFYYATETEFYLALIVPTLLFWIIGYYLAIIFHEAGHLVFGLMSGYRFSSFRIGSFILFKSRGKLKLGRFSLRGTGGQCIMTPPNAPEGRYPVMLYNLGGCIMNLILSVISFIYFFFFGYATYFTAFVAVFSIINFSLALTNIIPMKISGINNDGYNALNLSKNPAAMKALWHHLSLYRFLNDGLSLSEIPQGYFYEPEDIDLNDPIVAGYASAVFSRYLDSGDEEKAFSYAEHILSVSKGILPVHSLGLSGELLFDELCNEKRPEVIAKYVTPIMKRLFKAYKSSPTNARLAYAYERYCGNMEKAEKIKSAFYKSIEKYPYDGETRQEKKLFSKAENI